MQYAGYQNHMQKMLSARNPLVAPWTEADFQARWPGSTCKKMKYDTDMQVFIVRLADGLLVAAGANPAALWDKAYALLDKGCLESQRRASRMRSTNAVVETGVPHSRPISKARVTA
jgi:hypothetical protein